MAGSRVSAISLVVGSVLLLNACKGIIGGAAPIVVGSKEPVNMTRTAPVPGTSSTTPPPSFTHVSPPAAYSSHLSRLDLYFTNPEHPLSFWQTGGLDGPLVEAIDKAILSIDLAMYSLSLENVAYALIRAHHRGVRVRIVMESDNLDRSMPQRLTAAGIPIKGDQRDGLMHNKFMVLDNNVVWTGSMNFTYSSVYEDNNVLIRIESQEMALNFTREFEEMFVSDVFGAAGEQKTPYPRVRDEHGIMDVYFSPDDHPQDALLNIIRNAQQSINLLAFAFTSDPLGEAVRERASTGVLVHGVLDKLQAEFGLGDESLPFRQAGLDIRYGGQSGQIMHHKTIIIDQEIVVLGSYNFTNSANEWNDENLLVITNPSVAKNFMTEFNRLYIGADVP